MLNSVIGQLGCSLALKCMVKAHQWEKLQRWKVPVLYDNLISDVFKHDYFCTRFDVSVCSYLLFVVKVLLKGESIQSLVVYHEIWAEFKWLH